MPQQTIGGSTIAATTVSTRSDNTGVLPTIALPRTAVLQITIGQGMVVTGIVPNAATADIAAVITGTVFSGVVTGLSLETNGVSNQNQTLLNLINGLGVNVANTSGGTVQFVVDTNAVLAITGGTLTGSLNIYTTNPSLVLQDQPSGNEWLVQASPDGYFRWYYNTGSHVSPVWTARYTLAANGVPAVVTDLITKNFADATYVNVAGDSMTGALIAPQINISALTATLYITDTTGYAWAIQSSVGYLRFFVNTGSGFTQVYALYPGVNPVNDGDLVPYGLINGNRGQFVSASALKQTVASASVTAGNSTDVFMNEYAFGASLMSTGPTPSFHVVPTAATWDSTTNPKLRLETIRTGDSCVVAWRYLTATDNPRIYAAHKDNMIVGTWCSDDPVPQDVGIRTDSAETIQISDLSGIYLSKESLERADERIAKEKLNPENRLYRALQQQADADKQTMSQLILNNYKIGSGRLVEK